MANQEHLNILKQGVDVWNQWRQEHPDVEPDLSGEKLLFADLRDANLTRANLKDATLNGADLKNADLRDANLTRAELRSTDLRGANLNKADLKDANLRNVDLRGDDLRNVDLWGGNLSEAHLNNADLRGNVLAGANLVFADLSYADLTGTDLREADLSYADLTRATLSRTRLVGTNLANTILKDCSIYGIAAWDVQLDGAEQINLTITPENQPMITVDNLKIAQFIYLLLNNADIRDVIDTIAKKAVLILGRFTPERKAVLDGLREALRTFGYLPILFDFEKPSNRDFTETVSILAHLSRFVIVDLTNSSSVPYELGTLAHQCVVPFQPILLGGQSEFALLQDLSARYNWFLPTHSYRNLKDLLSALEQKIIHPAEQKAQELEKRFTN